MVKYGRNIKKKLHFAFLLVMINFKPFLGIFFFIIRVPSSFCCCEFLVNIFMKGLFLVSTTPTLPIFMVEIAVLLVLDIWLPSSSPILAVLC